MGRYAYKNCKITEKLFVSFISCDSLGQFEIAGAKKKRRASRLGYLAWNLEW